MSTLLTPQASAQATVQRRLTRAFVNLYPVTATMETLVTVDSPSGAKARTRLQARPTPVTFTLVEPSDSGYRGPLVDERGSRQAVDFEMVAEIGTDIREGDQFEARGHRYRVDSMMVPNDYEVRALVVRVN